MFNIYLIFGQINRYIKIIRYNKIAESLEFLLKEYKFSNLKNAMHFINYNKMNNKALMMVEIKNNIAAICFASSKLKDDKELILEAVKINSCSLKYASKRLKNDKEVAIAAIKENHIAFAYISDFLKNDKHFIQEIITLNGNIFEYIPNKFKDDESVVLEVFKSKEAKYNDFTKYISNSLINNKEFILSLIKHQPHIHEKYKDDEYFVMQAIKINGEAIRSASDRLQNNKELVLIAIENIWDSYTLTYLTQYWHDDKEVVLKTVKKHGYVLKYASDRLKDDKEVVLEAYKYTRDKRIYLELASPNIQVLLKNAYNVNETLEILINKEKLNNIPLPKKQIKCKSLKI